MFLNDVFINRKKISRIQQTASRNLQASFQNQLIKQIICYLKRTGYVIIIIYFPTNAFCSTVKSKRKTNKNIQKYGTKNTIVHPDLIRKSDQRFSDVPSELSYPIILRTVTVLQKSPIEQVAVFSRCIKIQHKNGNVLTNY